MTSGHALLVRRLIALELLIAVLNFAMPLPSALAGDAGEYHVKGNHRYTIKIKETLVNCQGAERLTNGTVEHLLRITF